MTPRLDLNADLGEHSGPPPSSDGALLLVVTSANVACGGHAGDEVSMRQTSAEAARLGVQIGAHPSFPDPDHFGRRVMPMTPAQITDTVARQVDALCVLSHAEGALVRHVKPHGALYNLACRDRGVADAIAAGIVLVDPGLGLYAPHGSSLAAAGAAVHLHVVDEGFLDRAYEDDGTLTPREVPGAVLHDPQEARVRAVGWARTGRVRSRAGRLLPLPIQTLCVHGDTPEAVAIVSQVRIALLEAGVALAPSMAAGTREAGRLDGDAP